MNWKEAVSMSARGVAERIDTRGRQVWRWMDGEAFAYGKEKNPVPLHLTPNEVEGFYDWQPCDK